MTKKEEELVEELKTQMPEFTGSKTDVEKKIAMYLYLYIGKIKVFDQNYFLGNEEAKKRLFRKYTGDLLKVKKNEISNGEEDPIIENKVGVCETIGNLYERLLNDFGINAKMIKICYDSACRDEKHVSILVTLSNGEQFLANPQEDLEKIQTRSITTNFGRKYEDGLETGEKISEDELFELHKACGYVSKKEDYMDYKIDKLAKKVEKMPASQILTQIINDPQINNFQDNIGYIELYKFYSGVIKTVAEKYSQNGINYFNCYRENKDNSKDVIPKREYYMCIYSTFNNRVNDIYIYSNKANKFGKIELENLKKLQEEGLSLGKNRLEPGKKILERALRNINTKVPENR